MDHEIFDKEGKCVRCGSTNVCQTCKNKGTVIPRGRTVTELMVCPTCKGKKECIFCHGKKIEKAIA